MQQRQPKVNRGEIGARWDFNHREEVVGITVEVASTRTR
jgi:hypothetical protein